LSALKKRVVGWDSFVAAFEEKSMTSKGKKKELLSMPKGCPRPFQRKHPLGVVLAAYTGKNSRCYDPGFDRTIRKRQPQWFVDGAKEKKRQILALRVGSPKPISYKHPLGMALKSYTLKSHTNKSYDPEFDKAIRARQPGWFKGRRAC
jgi:hypothetical protein